MAKMQNNGKEQPAAERLVSLDALRGLCVLGLGAGALALHHVAVRQSWQGWAGLTVPSDWNGCTAVDVLQVALLLAVGVALPYSYAGRLARGQAWPRQLVHALMRTLVLILLGIYVESYRYNMPVVHMRGELQMIGLAYLFGFLFVPLGPRAQTLAAGFLLAGHALAYAAHSSVSGHEPWGRGWNAGVFVDSWIGFEPHPQQYVTLNVVPATVVVLIGVLIGEFLRSATSAGAKIGGMLAAGAGCVIGGWALAGGGGPMSWNAVVPMVRSLGSTSFIIFAAGWSLLLLALFYLTTDGLRWRSWSVPLVLVGMNALIVSLAFALFRDWAHRSALLVLPASSRWIAPHREALAEALTVLLFWLLALGLYRRQIFIKL